MSDSITNRYTERALKIFALANGEAHRWNHEYIGTEHILIGLMKEDSGIGAHFLREHGFTLESLRTIVSKRVKPGPDTVTMGKLY